MDNKWLDNEQKFYNYHTQEVDGNNIFDLHKGSNSDAQQILDGSSYWKNEKNTYSEIVYMTPMQYFEACAKDCFDKPVERIITGRRADSKILDHLKEVILKYKKRFPLPYIDYATHGNAEQEGLHRMMVAGDLFGWDTKFPVQIIKWVDEERARREAEWKHIRKIERYLEIAINRALQYKYYNIDELKDQLYSEFESEVRYLNEFEGRDFDLQLHVQDDTVEVIVDNKYKNEFDKSKINFAEYTEEDNLEDLDFDDLSDWMKDLLKDLKLESLTEVMDVVHEFLISSKLQEELREVFGADFSSQPIQKAVCSYVKEKCSKCKLLDLAVGAWKYSNYTLEELCGSKYCVIRYNDKVYDFTSNQFKDQGVEKVPGVRVLSYNKDFSDKFGINLYNSGNYFVSAY